MKTPFIEPTVERFFRTLFVAPRVKDQTEFPCLVHKRSLVVELSFSCMEEAIDFLDAEVGILNAFWIYTSTTERVCASTLSN
jgi:hypothetical protein